MTAEMLLTLFVPAMTKSLMSALVELVKKSQQEKTDYIAKLADAEGDQIFKYLLLIHVATLDSYTAQARMQAQQSFVVSVVMAVAGFLLLTISIALGVVSQFVLKRGLEIAYLTAIGGILTQFISGVFFYLYSKTLEQINFFHAEIQKSQEISMGMMMGSLVTDPQLRDQAKADLAGLLLSRTLTEPRERPAKVDSAQPEDSPERRIGQPRTGKARGGATSTGRTPTK